MAWLFLIVAGALEVVWSLGLKATRGFTVLWPSLITGLAIVGSMYFLARAARTIPIGTAYAVWVGIGALGAAIGGAVRHCETITFARGAFLLLLVVAIIGLKQTSASPT
jgi:quaternary ammonium compound-resistance protein SugE